jgi:hypothetical protein
MVGGEFEYTAEDLWETGQAYHRARPRSIALGILSKLLAALLLAASLIGIYLLAGVAFDRSSGLTDRQHGRAIALCAILVIVGALSFRILIRGFAFAQAWPLRFLDPRAPGIGFRLFIFLALGTGLGGYILYLSEHPVGPRPQAFTYSLPQVSPWIIVLILLLGTICLERARQSWRQLGGLSVSRRLERDPRLRMRRRLTVTAEGLIIETIAWRRQIRWQQVARFIESKHVIVLCMVGREYAGISKRAFSAEGLSAFRAMLNSNVPRTL